MNYLTRHVERQIPFNIRRGLVHFAVGLSIAIAGFRLLHSLLLSILIPLSLIWLSIDLARMRFTRLGVFFNACFAPFLRNYERSRLTGASFLLVGNLVTFILFNEEIAILAVSFLAVGDPLAHFVRDRLGQTDTYTRSLVEALACLSGCTIVAVLWLNLANMSISLASVVTGVMTATIIQSLPLPIDDNLTMPVCAGAMMWIVQILFS
jgi:glycerol-3-phosphate acyltransferase PlsY